ncbi:cytochrome P450 76C2 isoform X1 [Physcomitrium patens]|uniref:Cytochrome P450 n=1 Tax=Physcomitrium patens TaxID=3218 RepID=A0A7I4A8P0_PHYPA|nr:flavonoid 3',5'-hydroxylase-like isoform X1 [Physcomitrium patens]|eukprot:XP_024387828.1 flavonoid 3',5'-hydroxylase-like isoform X1 [Physcomitrella patens]
MAEGGLLFGFELADVLVAAVLISVVVLYFHAEALQRRRCPPGPWPWPVVGNFSALGDLPYRNLHKLAGKYGGLMYLRLGVAPTFPSQSNNSVAVALSVDVSHLILPILSLEMTSSVFELLGSVVISDFVPYLSFITKLQGHASKFSKIRDVSDKLTADFFDLDSHRNNYKKMKNDPSYVPDFEDVLMETPFENGTNLPDQDLLKLLQELLNAGTETSSNTSEWAMAELIRRPELIERAQTEMDSVIGSKRLVEESDIQQLPFLQAVMKENFRLHPPAPLLLPHESREPTELLGYHFPAGTELLVNAFAIHRDPSVYDNPDSFDPDRFLARPHVDHMSTSDPYELMPFGKGLRMCPGYRLANTMVALMLANLLYVFDWSLPEGQTEVDMTETIGISVRKKQPLFLVPKPRFELSLESVAEN